MIALIARMGLPEVIGWAVAIALIVICRYAEAAGRRLAARVRRAARVLTAYGRTRAAAMRRPHGHRRPRPRLAAAALAAHLHLTRFTIPGGTSR